MRKRICLCICGLLLLLGLSACSEMGEGGLDAAAQEETQAEDVQEPQAAEQSAPEEQISEEQEDVQAQSDSGDAQGNGVLIAYFTWADNTVVTDEEAALQSALSHYESIGDSAEYEGTDATSSASVLAPGNTAQLAQWIGQGTGGELFSIRTMEPYPSDYDECMDRASEELAEDARPELSAHVENMDQYDTIFLGYPNWWADCPMAVLSFIEECDLSGKTVALFCSHGTGGVGRSVRTITEALPEDCTVIDDVLGVYRPDVPGAQSEVQEWLSRIGLDGAGEAAEDAGAENMETEETDMTQTENRQIRVLTEDGGTIVFELNDSSAADDLYAQLPLTTQIEDFSTNEKIFYPEELDISDTPQAGTEIGTLAYYAPWGDVVMFYEAYQANASLYELGYVVSGEELIPGLSGTVTIEAAD